MGSEAAAPREQRIETLIASFERQFGRRPEGIAEAPGRVNLIGEHVDYNDGLVLPLAIDRSVLCAWAASDLKFPLLRDNQADQIRVHSVDESQSYAFHPNIDGDWDGNVGPTWAQYVNGVYDELLGYGPRADRQIPQHGGEFALTGDVPQGAGLSSSAALEVAVAGALRDAFSLPIDDVALAKLCQRAENEYVGVQCGIMDQFASTLAQRDHALLIDCRTLAYEHVPLRLAEASLAVVIVNSAVQRELASSAYNERRRECERAVAVLRERLDRADLTSLRDVTAADLDRAAHSEGDAREATALRRARHVVSEIARVAAAVDALRAADFASLGELMDESHLSLRDDYDVSSPQLDLLVGLATAQDYVLGARLTGAGFGGCTVNLVRADAIDAFDRDVIAPYRERAGLPAVMYVTSPQDGLRTWRL